MSVDLEKPGRQTTGIDAVEFARQVVDRGAGEILLTSMDRDGTKAGYDIALTRTIGLARAVELGGRRFGFTARAVPLDDPLAAVDVDKPEDLALAEAVLGGETS